MRNISSAVVICSGLMISPVWAQNAQPSDSSVKPANTALDAMGVGQTMSSDYIDRNVYGQGDQSIGEIKDLVIDASNGSISSVIIGVGGFLGIGEKNVAIPFAQVKPMMKDGKVWLSISSSKEELKAAPDFIRRSAMANKPVAPSMTATAPAAAPSAMPAPAANAPAATADNAGTRNPPLPGANSFTEAQVRTRLEGMGYSGVTGLAKDDQSIWRGAAMKDGKNVNIAVDYKGNVVSQ